MTDAAMVVDLDVVEPTYHGGLLKAGGRSRQTADPSEYSGGGLDWTSKDVVSRRTARPANRRRPISPRLSVDRLCPDYRVRWHGDGLASQ